MPKNKFKFSKIHSELNFWSTLTFLLPNFFKNHIFLEKGQKPIWGGGISGPKRDPNLTQNLPKIIFWGFGAFFYLIMNPRIGFRTFSKNI